MKIKRKNLAKTKTIASHRSKSAADIKQPFIDHAFELRRRIYYIVASVSLTGAGIYFIQQHVVNALLKPAHGQSFIYTSPGGGIDFLFKVCIYGGLIISTPVIVYNLLGFMSPIISHSNRSFVVKISLITSVLAIAGVAFGYFVGLPAALHFLLHQFKTVQIKPLVTIQSYLNFVMAYMLGSALIFQLPIFLICINRIKPLKPSKLFGYERWVILAAFVLAGLMNPTPNLVSQLMVAGPFILMYQVGIGIIAITNRSKRPHAINNLLENDAMVQQQRFEQAKQALIVEVKAVAAEIKSATTINTEPNKPLHQAKVSKTRSIQERPAQQPLVSRSMGRGSYMDFIPNNY
jgi:sec-independent protein translocase protein TatC